MEFNSTGTLSDQERNIRRWGALGTVAAALFLIWLQISPGDGDIYAKALFDVSTKTVITVLLYGIFSLWCVAHLDVIGDRAFAGRVGRVAALRLGLASRAFGHCGCWSKALRQRTWRLMNLGHKPARLKAIVRISNAAHVFGLVYTFCLVNAVFPQFLSNRLGMDVEYTRFIFVLLIAGSMMLAWQRGAGLWRERAQAALLVALYQSCAAISVYALCHNAIDASFGELWAVVILASGVGWALRVPFVFGVLEVALLFLALPGQAPVVLAGITLYHIFFQGPALLISLWINFAPSLAVPVLLGGGEGTAPNEAGNNRLEARLHRSGKQVVKG